MLWTWQSPWIMRIMILKILRILRRCVSSWSSLKISTHRKNLEACIEEHLALDLCLRVCAVVQGLIYIHIVGNTVEKHNLNECGLKAESWNMTCNSIRSFLRIPEGLLPKDLVLCFWTVITEKSDRY